MTLAVRTMVLYKHGVGFFMREGTISGKEVVLTFRADEVNDVLKSLAVFDRAGGKITGIHYQTPMDKVARLASSSIDLDNEASVRDLIRDLRGRLVTLQFETTPGTLESITGRVIGIDSIYPNHSSAVTADLFFKIAILAESGAVRIFDINTLRQLQILDTQSERDLTYFLDTSMSEDDRRTVNVRLSEGQHQLVVNYVAPSPTWRVSYRIVAETDAGQETGKALLQGWGLFDNRLDEDLEDVMVTLVAGQPISFIYELYASRIPVRPTVQDEARIAPGPIEFAGELEMLEADKFQPMNRVGGLAKRASSAPFTRTALAAAEPSPDFLAMASAPSRQELAQAAPPAAEAKESGEFFQYVVTTPVSVKRGESALVPIIGAEVEYRRELLYNGSKLPKHPVAALRFLNTTELTFERGPVTIVEDQDYKGEAVVPFTKANNEVYLPYAVELGVKVVEAPSDYHETVSLNIKDGLLIYHQYHIKKVMYTIENTTAKSVTILIEAAKVANFEPFEMPNADVETVTERRWRVEVSAHKKLEFVRQERRRTQTREELRRLDYRRLQNFLSNKWLDQTTFEKLSEMLDNLALMQRITAEQGKLEKERKTVYEKQEQLRANLQTLQPTGQEANLRNRMLSQLEATQNRLEAIEQQLADLALQATQADEQVNTIITSLG